MDSLMALLVVMFTCGVSIGWSTEDELAMVQMKMEIGISSGSTSGSEKKEIGQLSVEAEAARGKIGELIMEQAPCSQIMSSRLAVLKEVADAFSRAEIPWWISGGTLMATRRGVETMLHDNDIDIEVFASDEMKIRSLLAPSGSEAFPNRRFSDKEYWADVPFVALEMKASDGDWLHALDIWLRADNLDEPSDNSKWFLSKEEVWPLKRSQFHGINVWSPGDPDNGISRIYGEDWKHRVRVLSHSDFDSDLKTSIPIDLPIYKDVAQNLNLTAPSLSNSLILTEGGMVDLSRADECAMSTELSGSQSGSGSRTGSGSGSGSRALLLTSTEKIRSGSQSGSGSRTGSRSGSGSRALLLTATEKMRSGSRSGSGSASPKRRAGSRSGSGSR